MPPRVMVTAGEYHDQPARGAKQSHSADTAGRARNNHAFARTLPRRNVNGHLMAAANVDVNLSFGDRTGRTRKVPARPRQGWVRLRRDRNASHGDKRAPQGHLATRPWGDVRGDTPLDQ